MKRRTIRLAASILLLVAALATACAPKDPRQKVLEERGLWKIDLLSWAGGEDGLILSIRLTGPVHSSIETLTFRLEMRDAAGEVLDRKWWSVDVTTVERGGPKDLLLRIPVDDAGAVEQMSIDPVLDPTDDEAPNIPELVSVAVSP